MVLFITNKHMALWKQTGPGQKKELRLSLLLRSSTPRGSISLSTLPCHLIISLSYVLIFLINTNRNYIPRFIWPTASSASLPFVLFLFINKSFFKKSYFIFKAKTCIIHSLSSYFGNMRFFGYVFYHVFSYYNLLY